MFPLQRGPWQGRKSAFVRLQLGAKRARFAGQAWTWPCWVVPGGKCHIDRRPGFCPGPGEISLGRLPGVCGAGWGTVAARPYDESAPPKVCAELGESLPDGWPGPLTLASGLRALQRREVSSEVDRKEQA